MLLVCLIANGSRAQTNTVQIAVMPFSAPLGNPALQAAADSFPDLLTSALSRDNRFSLVERDKINAVWNEFHLTEAGLVSADTVMKLGHTLSCDWLVAGSFVQAATNRLVWIKVIDTQTSVVLDLQALPCNPTNFSVTASAIGNFLAQARSRSKPREFVAMEELRDMSMSATREDLTPRLTAMIESNLLAAGYGVVEREDVSPIFSEYQLQSAGMTADAAKRVKLKPVFWIVGGSWKWFYDTQNKLSVTLDIRRMGTEARMTNFASVPGEALDKAILDGLQTVLKDSGSLTADEALAAEVKLRSARIHEQIEGRDIRTPTQRHLDNMPPTTVTTTNSNGTKNVMTVNPEMIAQWQTHSQETLNTLHQEILLNPKDMKAKFTLGKLMYNDGTNSENAKVGDELMEEVIASGDPVYAKRAEYWRDDIHSGKISFKRSPWGTPLLIVRGDPASLPVHTLSGQELAKAAADAAKWREVTNLAVWAEKKMVITQNPGDIAYLNGAPITAYSVAGALGRGPLLIARGTNLHTFNWTGTFGYGSGTDFQKFDLPLKLEHPITAITGDESTLWLGTDGGGLIKIPAGGGPPVVFGEKDGFPMASVRSLALARGKLFIGFGRGHNGAFGYLDITTSKFTGLMSPNTGAESDDEAFPPPPPRNAVCQIRSGDEANTWWIGCDSALYRLDWDSQKWTLELPRPGQREVPQVAGLRTLTADRDYVVNILSPGGIGICKISEDRWSHLNLSTNFLENRIGTVAIDDSNPKYVWLGGIGKISIIDMSAQKIVGQYKMATHGYIRLIILYPKDVFLIGDGDYSESYILYHWLKPEYP
jgi:TolB-like protein